MKRLPSPLQTAPERSSSTSLCAPRGARAGSTQRRGPTSPRHGRGQEDPARAGSRDREDSLLCSAHRLLRKGCSCLPEKSGITLPRAKTLGLAHEFSEAHGAYDPATDFWKACTLEECVTYFGGKAPETAAASEAEAAAFTFRELLRDPWYRKPRTKPLKSIEVATGKTFWDYGDEEG